MSDYAFVHNDRAYTPNQTNVAVEDAGTHNAGIEAAELARWAANPDMFGFAYFTFPAEEGKPYRDTFAPDLTGAAVSTWLGTVLGQIIKAKVFPHNFGCRQVALIVKGTNGAIYHGRASYDRGQCIRLRRSGGT